MSPADQPAPDAHPTLTQGNEEPDRRVILITGASRGIGRALATALAGPRVRLIALARTSGALEELDDEITAAGGAATLTPADLKDPDALDRLGAAIYQRWGRLDGLVGNAGVLGPLTPTPHIEPKDWTETVAVNLTANARLIRAMDPLLRLSPAGRAVFVTSAKAPKPAAFWGAYAATKAGLEALVQCYADETRTSAVRVNLFDPGPTATAMRKKAMPGEDPASLPTASEVARHILPLLSPEETRHGARVAYRELAPSSA